MNRLLLPVLAAVAAPLAPAHADNRLVERLYDPAKVVLVEGKTNVQATIAFAEDETIENVAIGDSTSWQVTPNKRANLLFVKPLAARASTNMTVVTNERTYLFDLVAKPDAKALYVLRFTYPEEPATKEEPAQLAGAANAVEVAAATDPYAVADPARLNFAWHSEGSAKLIPSEIYDDGDATFLTWPADATIPAILIKDRKGTEGPVNYAVRGETTVVDGVPAEIILRWGDDVATLTNLGAQGAMNSAGKPALALKRETN